LVDKTAVENYNKSMVKEQKPDKEPVVPEVIDAGPENQLEQIIKKYLSHDAPGCGR
jgi:hypothetical protein